MIAGPDAVLLSWLPGQEGGNCAVDILAGKENPSGRLPMTWPVSYNDVPFKVDSQLETGRPTTLYVYKQGHRYMGNVKNVDYTEHNDGVYVGYRYYQTKNVPVSFPFGYGMSYTTFKYGKPVVTKDAQGNIKVLVTVKNAGKVAAAKLFRYMWQLLARIWINLPRNSVALPRLRNCSLRVGDSYYRHPIQEPRFFQ